MKHTKKLIPAIGMLLLSACMLVTSTFAWFSMNEKVTATGMSVMAKGNQIYLQITDEDTPFVDGSGITEAVATNKYVADTDDSDKLLPTNVKDKATGNAYNGSGDIKWVTAVGKDYDKADHNEAGYSDLTSTAGYVLENTFYIRLDPSAGNLTANKELYVKSVTVKKVKDGKETTTADTFDKCIGVLVVNESTETKMGCAWGYANKDAAEMTCLNDSANLTATKFNNSGTTGDQISVYVFFNGDHETCTLQNLAQILTTEYTVSVEFAVE